MCAHTHNDTPQLLFYPFASQTIWLIATLETIECRVADRNSGFVFGFLRCTRLSSHLAVMDTKFLSLVPCPAVHISLLFPGKILKKRNGDTRGWRGDGSRAQPPSTIDRSIPLILENMTPLERSAGGRAGFPPFRLRSE